MAEKENADLLADLEATESWLITLSREFGRTLRRGKDGIDVLVDATGSALNTTTTITKKLAGLPKRDRSLSPSEEALFQELGAKVAECPGGDYLSLKNDVRFWELVKQLHAIRGKAAAQAVIEQVAQQDEPIDQAPQQDEPSDSSPENS